MGGQWISEAKSSAEFYKALFDDSSVPTFLIQGSADERYNRELYDSFAKKHNAKNLVIDNADHNFNNLQHRIILIDMVKDYFNSFIK